MPLEESSLRRRLSRAVLVALCCSALPARAQGSPGSGAAGEASETDITDAVRDAVAAGFAEYKAGHLRMAREHLQKAWRLRPSKAIAQGLAQVEMDLGLYVDAAEHWEYVLEQTDDESWRAAIEEKLEECLQNLGRLRVELNVSGATLYVDGKKLESPSSSEELRVAAGPGVLRIERAGYQPHREELTVRPGEVVEVYVLLERAEPPSVDVPATASLPADSEPTAARTVVIVSGAALTATALVMGGIFRWQADKHDRDADTLRATTLREGDPDFARHDGQCLPEAPSRPAACGALSRSVDDGLKSDRQSTVAFVSGAVLGVATITTWLLWPSRDPESSPNAQGARWSLSPYGAPSSRGVVLSGHF